jgi:NADH:ubiquinone oxidoreductase subunit 3 (subunit A)
MHAHTVSIFVFVGLGLIFWMAALAASHLVRPHRPSPSKASAYECGLEPVGRAWYQVHVRYYIYALLFVLFDVEVAFLYPWAVVFRRLEGWQTTLLIEAVLFLVILMVGLVYAWRKGALEWE